jgi:hypothetical protein
MGWMLVVEELEDHLEGDYSVFWVLWPGIPCKASDVWYGAPFDCAKKLGMSFIARSRGRILLGLTVSVLETFARRRWSLGFAGFCIPTKMEVNYIPRNPYLASQGRVLKLELRNRTNVTGIKIAPFRLNGAASVRLGAQAYQPRVCV